MTVESLPISPAVVDVTLGSHSSLLPFLPPVLGRNLPSSDLKSVRSSFGKTHTFSSPRPSNGGSLSVIEDDGVVNLSSVGAVAVPRSSSLSLGGGGPHLSSTSSSDGTQVSLSTSFLSCRSSSDTAHISLSPSFSSETQPSLPFLSSTLKLDSLDGIFGTATISSGGAVAHIPTPLSTSLNVCTSFLPFFVAPVLPSPSLKNSPLSSSIH